MKNKLLILLASFLYTLSVQAQDADEGPQENVTVAVNKRYTTEMNNLAKRPAVKQAFQVILELEPQTTRELIMLTEIPAPPFKEEIRAQKYAQMLKEAGADSVWIDEVGNVIAKRKGHSGKSTVALDAHLDTVFPEGTDVKVKQKGDTLFAPGIGDDTRGLIMVLTVLRGLEKANIETEADVLFIGTVGEEGLGDLRGVKHLFSENGPKIDSWIAVDGGELGGIAHRGLGSHRYRVTFKGPGGHSWGAFGMANPHNALSRAVYHFTTEADKFTREGIKTSYNVGRIGGGTSVNSIPFESWMEVDMRSESPEKLQGVDDILQKAIQKGLKEENQAKRRGPDLTVDIKMVGDRPSGKTDPTITLVQRTMASVQYFNAKPELRAGSTDSNIPISKGVPAVTIGRGGVGGGAHSLGEWWMNKDGHLAIQQALLLVLAEAGMAKGK
ncbi:M20/M25/M40 family metallo-hydrolase [Rhodocytophaga rosea]|uniref:M20/M25/M40 family metallo-hydrolase n=1 Tax=Rhodocytophaga rosea TaxID=2704465 RepID=A0A6C0GJS5_9BACT|nr:M20/M25/M40 family metallo-hydrolase [Rhodocytophaga rosea]QHT67933.1 M20/M25/M40 family metallo-hydrolase [Rhodocytophaga rosea]